MGRDYEVVDFGDLDLSRISLLPCFPNGFGGQSRRILYGGKKLYVLYGGRRCRRGVVRWGNGNNPSYTVTIEIEDGDRYFDKIMEIDDTFRYNFGSLHNGGLWSGLSRGEMVTLLDFKIPTNGAYTETKFFLDGYGRDCFNGPAAEDCIPLGSKIGILANWDRVSFDPTSYGAVIRPKALQIRILEVPDLLDERWIDLPEVEYSDCWLDVC